MPLEGKEKWQLVYYEKAFKNIANCIKKKKKSFLIKQLRYGFVIVLYYNYCCTVIENTTSFPLEWRNKKTTVH